LIKGLFLAIQIYGSKMVGAKSKRTLPQRISRCWEQSAISAIAIHRFSIQREEYMLLY